MNLFNHFVTEICTLAKELGYTVKLETTNGKRQGVVYTHYVFTVNDKTKRYLTAIKEDFGPSAMERYKYKISLASAKGEISMYRTYYVHDYFSIRGKPKARRTMTGLIKNWFENKGSLPLPNQQLLNTLKECENELSK